MVTKNELREKGEISACNHYFADYQLHGAAFSLSGPIGSTMMACEGPVMDQESDFLQKLEKMRFIQVDQDNLLLVSADGLFLTFEK